VNYLLAAQILSHNIDIRTLKLLAIISFHAKFVLKTRKNLNTVKTGDMKDDYTQ
jgi:hypothetical protein